MRKENKIHNKSAGSVAQLDAHPTGDQEVDQARSMSENEMNFSRNTEYCIYSKCLDTFS